MIDLKIVIKAHSILIEQFGGSKVWSSTIHLLMETNGLPI